MNVQQIMDNEEMTNDQKNEAIDKIIVERLQGDGFADMIPAVCKAKEIPYVTLEPSKVTAFKGLPVKKTISSVLRDCGVVNPMTGEEPLMQHDGSVIVKAYTEQEKSKAKQAKHELLDLGYQTAETTIHEHGLEYFVIAYYPR